MNMPFQDSSNLYRPMSQVNGVMIAIVTNNKDPEKLHRVKLKMPLIEGESETDWVRVATLMGGKEMGTLFLPEVGDEVLVAFHLGEAREPYVIGSLWSNKTKPPSNGEDNNLRKIHSKSGHEIEFDDKSGDEKVTVKTKKGHKIEMLDKSNTIKISESGSTSTVEIKGGASAEITVKSGSSSVKLDSKGEVTITGGTTLKIKATQIQIEADAALTIKGGAEVNIQSSGLLNIKGSMVKIN